MGLSCTALRPDRLPLCTGDFGAPPSISLGPVHRGAQRQLLMKGGAVIEAARRGSRMWPFDKTGT